MKKKATRIKGISNMSYYELAKRLRHEKDGSLTWLFSRKRDLIGKRAGNKSKINGYITIKFGKNKKRYLAHRVAFLLDHGYLPNEVDHKNGDTSDNRTENLRDSTRAQNAANRKSPNVKKTSKYKGVCFDKNRNKWMAGIKLNQRRTYLGRFPSEEDAARAYNQKAQELLGEFANLNII